MIKFLLFYILDQSNRSANTATIIAYRNINTTDFYFTDIFAILG